MKNLSRSTSPNFANLSSALHNKYDKYGRFWLLLVSIPFSALVAEAQGIPKQGLTLNNQPSVSRPATIEAKSRRRFPLFGPEASFVYTLDAKSRARFGATAFSIDPGIGDLMPPLKGDIDFDFSFTQTSRNESDGRNHLLLVVAGPQFWSAYLSPKTRQAIQAATEEGNRKNKEASSSELSAPPSGAPPAANPLKQMPAFSLLPYYGGSLDLVFADVKSPVDNVRGSGFGAGGSAFVGAEIYDRAFAEVRLRETTQVLGFHFSSIGYTLGLRF